MTFLRFLLLCYAFGGVFIAGGLFFRRVNSSYMLLSAFILLFSLEALEFLYSTSVMVEYLPFFYGRYYFISGFLYGPILLFYFRSLFRTKGDKKAVLIHFAPALVVFFSMLDIQFLGDVERIQFFSDHFLDRIMPINYARGLHNLGYGIYFIVLIGKQHKKLDDANRLFTLAFCGMYFLTAVLVSWLTVFAGGWRDFIFYYLIAFSIVFITGYLLYRDPEFLQGMRMKYLGSSLDESEMKAIHSKIAALFLESKVYLNGNLSLAELGALIDEKPQRISQTLSVLLEDNFNSFVNKYRVEYAKSLFRNPEFDHYKIEAIGLESGFNNKVTFNRAFKDYVSMSPSEFKQTSGR